jgi:predicted permease
VQLAATLVLLTAAGLLVNGFVRLLHVDAGFRSEGLSVAAVSLPRWRFPDRAATELLLQQLKSEASKLPGVSSAALADAVPPHMSFTVAGNLETVAQGAVNEPDAYVSFAAVDEGFFATLDIPLVAGRSFTAADTQGRLPAAIVSRALARHLWPNADAIGKRFRMDAREPWLTVVGIAGDVRNGGFDSPRGVLAFYTSRAQSSAAARSQALVLRAASTTDRVIGMVPSVVRRVLPGAPIWEVERASDLIADEHSRLRFATFLMSGLAGVAVALAVLGVYGAFWCAVRQRTREIGVRLAIGAQPRDIMAMVLSSSARLALAGLIIGLPIALAVARTLTSLFFEVSPADPLTFVAVMIGLFVAALTATSVPAFRGSRIDPSSALRDQ